MKLLRDRVEECEKRHPSISRAEIARAAGVKQPSVADWFNGKTVRLKLAPAVGAARLWQCDPAWLGEGIGSPGWFDAVPAVKGSFTSSSQPDLSAALPVVLARLPGLDDYSARKVITAVEAALKPSAPLETIEKDLIALLSAPPSGKRQNAA